MPRRNQRGTEPEPLAITPDDIPRPKPPRQWIPQEEWEARKDARDEVFAQRRKVREQAERRKRVQEAINWDFCIVPGCLARVRIQPYLRDVDLRLPICDFHAVIVKQQIAPSWERADVVEARQDVQKHRELVQDGQERSWEIATSGGHSKGQIYFLRLNGLVKVGWSSNVVKRFKAYGPEVEILCHYPASRQDETLMHRQLRPYLAKGREWYQDCKLIEDVVAKLVEQHGPPKLSATWTEPAPPIVAGKHNKGIGRKSA